MLGGETKKRKRERKIIKKKGGQERGRGEGSERERSNEKCVKWNQGKWEKEKKGER